MDPQEARTQLERLLSELQSATAVLEREDLAGSDELSHADPHRAGTASEISDNDREQAIIEAAGERMVEVKAALVRLDEEIWGICIDCGKPIPQARLAARPEAARCVQDQARFESALSS